VLVVSSGAVYDARQALPLTEESRIGHGSPYVVSKLLVEHQAGYYATRGLDVVVARPFNHIGPGQGPGFLVPDLYGAVRAAATTDGIVRVGDLDTRRDYTDVRDVVRAYRLLLEADELEHRLFNVCSGRSWSGRELLDLLAEALDVRGLTVEVDPARVRPDDPREVVGSAARLDEAVGWKPAFDVVTSITDFVTGNA
jgi:GDP-4-dehydro-6-deoxy-D-mannose reductase